MNDMKKKKSRAKEKKRKKKWLLFWASFNLNPVFQETELAVMSCDWLGAIMRSQLYLSNHVLGPAFGS